jgi:hypothetical protein
MANGNGGNSLKNISILIGLVSILGGVGAGAVSWGLDWSSWQERMEAAHRSTRIEMLTREEAHALRRGLLTELRGWVREQYPVAQAVLSKRLDDHERQIAALSQALRELEKRQ